MTGAARGPCRGSGPPSSRPGWCVQSQNMSCTSISCAVCLSCRVETLKAAFSMASLAWNGKRRHQILLFLCPFSPSISFKVGNIIFSHTVRQYHSYILHQHNSIPKVRMGNLLSLETLGSPLEFEIKFCGFEHLSGSSVR